MRNDVFVRTDIFFYNKMMFTKGYFVKMIS